MVSGTFAYRLVNDDAGAIHHTFQLGAGSPRTAEGEPERELRWFALGGLSPRSDNSYGVRRSIGGQNRTVADRLGWSGFILGGGLTKAFPRPDGALEISGDAQLQGLSVGYVKNANQTTGQEAVDVSTKQLRLRGGGSYQSGRFTGLAQVAGFLYLGDGTEKLRGMPLRGAFVEDDLGGFASGPQSFELRVGGAVELTQTISASLRYAFVGYSQSDWASAHLVHAEGAARFGRVRAALGFTWQYDAPQIAAPGSGVGDYSSLYLTGSIGYAF